MKKNGGLKTVRSSCGDETSRWKKREKNRSQEKGPAPLNSRKKIQNKARNGSFGDDMCPNRGSPSIDAKLCSSWDLPPIASANYVSPWLVNDGSGLQSSKLSLHGLIHCSLIGRVLELWILLEWRLLLWCRWSGCRDGISIFYYFVW